MLHGCYARLPFKLTAMVKTLVDFNHHKNLLSKLINVSSYPANNIAILGLIQELLE